MNDFIKNGFSQAQQILNDVASDTELHQVIRVSIEALVNCFKNGGSVFSCGNGGSMCDSMHFAEELTGRFRKERKPLPAQSISDPSHITCVGNDYGHDQIFSRHIEAWGKKGDILLAISTSGNSLNVIKAAQVAQEKDMLVIGLLGKGGGELSKIVNFPIIVPETTCTDRIQEIHIKVIHLFIEGIERKLFPENY